MTRLQEKILRAILRHAIDDVPLYHEKYELVGIKPEDVKTLEDLAKLPFMTKEEVRSNVSEKSLTKAYAIKDHMKVATSGTS